MKKPKNTHTRNTILRPKLYWISRLVCDPIERSGTRSTFLTGEKTDGVSVNEHLPGRVGSPCDGSVNHYKAELVPKGYAQKHGINYDETFASVAKMTIIRVLWQRSGTYIRWV